MSDIQQLAEFTKRYHEHNKKLEEKYGGPTVLASSMPPNPTPDLERLSVVTRRYRAHNQQVEEGQSEHTQKCTVAELELITRNTHYTLGKALRRIERLEKKMGIVASPEEY